MFNGIFSAIVTPFSKDLKSIDYESFENLISYQLKNEISGLVICGSTGEAATLTSEEYFSVLKFAKEKVNGACQIIAGIGTNNTNFACEMAQKISPLKYDGILVVSPAYNKPSQEGIYQHMLAVSKSTSTPIIAYNVPGRTVSNILPDTVERLVNDKVIVALKEASGNFSQLNETLFRVRNKIDVLLGEDAFICPSLLLGAKGGISVISNVLPSEMVKLYKAMKNNEIDFAKELHFKLLPFMNLLFSESNPIPVKYALYTKGIIKNYGLRLPLLSATEKTQSLLDKAFKGV